MLDNCEHVIAACAEFATALLQNCPGLQLLATSREALNVAGEAAWLVPPLSTPDPQQRLSAALLQSSEAARLFIERATTAQSNFAVTEHNALPIAQMRRRLAESLAVRVGIGDQGGTA